MRPGGAAGEHRDVAGLEVVDQRDLELVRVVAARHVIDVAIEPGARAPDQDQRLVERPDLRRQHLMAIAQLVQHVRQDRRVEPARARSRSPRRRLLICASPVLRRSAPSCAAPARVKAKSRRRRGKALLPAIEATLPCALKDASAAKNREATLSYHRDVSDAARRGHGPSGCSSAARGRHQRAGATDQARWPEFNQGGNSRCLGSKTRCSSTAPSR